MGYPALCPGVPETKKKIKKKKKKDFVLWNICVFLVFWTIEMNGQKVGMTSLFCETAGFAPPITGEEICASLKTVAQHLDAVIPKGRNAWEVVVRSGDVATGLEVTGLVLRGRSLELSQRFPGGTWVRVRGLPLEAGDLTVRSIFENFGEVVSGPHHVMWRGTTIKTGDRTLKVKLKREIPQSFSTLGGKTKVTVRYRDQPKTCFSCGATGHERRDCPAQEESTYARAVANVPTVEVANTPTMAVVDPPTDVVAETPPPRGCSERSMCGGRLTVGHPADIDRQRPRG